MHASGVTPDATHVQHIHYGQQALNECPTLALDSNKDGRLNTVEGVPAYGPVVVSLNTTGRTTPSSFLDVTRLPVSKGGSDDYSRKSIKITSVPGTGYAGGGTAKQIAESIREGEGVLVIYGIDYNGNGTSERVPVSAQHPRDGHGERYADAAYAAQVHGGHADCASGWPTWRVARLSAARFCGLDDPERLSLAGQTSALRRGDAARQADLVVWLHGCDH